MKPRNVCAGPNILRCVVVAAAAAVVVVLCASGPAACSSGSGASTAPTSGRNVADDWRAATGNGRTPQSIGSSTAAAAAATSSRTMWTMGTSTTTTTTTTMTTVGPTMSEVAHRWWVDRRVLSPHNTDSAVSSAKLPEFVIEHSSSSSISNNITPKAQAAAAALAPAITPKSLRPRAYAGTPLPSPTQAARLRPSHALFTTTETSLPLFERTLHAHGNDDDDDASDASATSTARPSAAAAASSSITVPAIVIRHSSAARSGEDDGDNDDDGGNYDSNEDVDDDTEPDEDEEDNDDEDDSVSAAAGAASRPGKHHHQQLQQQQQQPPHLHDDDDDDDDQHHQHNHDHHHHHHHHHRQHRQQQHMANNGASGAAAVVALAARSQLQHITSRAAIKSSPAQLSPLALASSSASAFAAAVATNSTPPMKSHKTDAPMLNYIFDSHLATNKHIHHDRNGPQFEDAARYAVADMNVTVQIGTPAFLNCRINLLQDKTVSWVKREPANDRLDLLTVGKQTYTGDSRFSVEFQYPNNWRLRIADANKSDEGVYECQISTYPPRVIQTFLCVRSPEVCIADEHGALLVDKFYEVDSTIQLVCIVRHIAMTTSAVYWLHGDRMLNFDMTRGGISVRTDLMDNGANSTLSIAKIGKQDSGNYTCSIGPNDFYTMTMHVLNGESLAELYHGSSTARVRASCVIQMLVLGLAIAMRAGFGRARHRDVEL